MAQAAESSLAAGGNEALDGHWMVLDGAVGDISAGIVGLQAPPFLAMCKFLAFRALGDVDPAERPGELFSLRRALLITVLNHLCILFLGNDENVI